MARLVFGSSSLSYRGVRLAVSTSYTGGGGVLTPPPGWTGLVSELGSGQTVFSPHDDPRREYVPAASWQSHATYGGGMHYKDYFTAQDGSVYYSIEVFARSACAVEFYVLRDDNDSANFAVVEGGRLLAQGSSLGPITRTPDLAATVDLLPGAHTLYFQVLSGNSLYASHLIVRTP